MGPRIFGDEMTKKIKGRLEDEKYEVNLRRIV
jgi:hypothetical protein